MLSITSIGANKRLEGMFNSEFLFSVEKGKMMTHEKNLKLIEILAYRSIKIDQKIFINQYP